MGMIVSSAVGLNSFSILTFFSPGYGKKDTHNDGFDDDEVPPYGSVQRPGNTEASAGRPSAARWQSWGARKTPVKTAVNVQRLQNARPVVGGVHERPDQPLVFPLQGGSANNLVAPSSPGSGNLPSSDWQRKTATGGSSAPGFNAGSGTKGANKRPLIYEEVYKYPGQGSGALQNQGSGALQNQGSNPQAAGGGSQASHGSLPGHALPQRQPAQGGARPVQPSRPVSSHQSWYQPQWDRVSRQQNPAQAYRSPEGYRPAPPHPPSYIIQSSNKYERFRKTYRKSSYTPDYIFPQSEDGPALQPTAQLPFKGPQRYSHFKLNAFY